MVWDVPGAFVVRLHWRPVGEGGDREMFQVLRVRDRMIREMADYATIGPATKTAKRFAAA